MPRFALNHRLPHRRVAWLVGAALLWAALSPLCLHLLQRFEGPNASAGWTEVCTLLGAKRVRVGSLPSSAGNESPGSSSSLAGLGHCAACALHFASFALPPAPAWTPWLAQFGHESPRGAVAELHAREAWLAAAPRGPPIERALRFA